MLKPSIGKVPCTPSTLSFTPLEPLILFVLTVAVTFTIRNEGASLIFNPWSIVFRGGPLVAIEVL